jgi:hypothetical protein
MNTSEDRLAYLKRRVLQHDDNAARELREELAQRIGYRVRWVMRARRGSDLIDRLILDEVNRLPSAGYGVSPDEEADLVRLVARRASAAFVDHLRPRRPAGLSSSQRMCETVCA